MRSSMSVVEKSGVTDSVVVVSELSSATNSACWVVLVVVVHSVDSMSVVSKSVVSMPLSVVVDVVVVSSVVDVSVLEVSVLSVLSADESSVEFAIEFTNPCVVDGVNESGISSETSQYPLHSKLEVSSASISMLSQLVALTQEMEQSPSPQYNSTLPLHASFPSQNSVTVDASVPSISVF